MIFGGNLFAELHHDDVGLDGLDDPADVVAALLREVRSTDQVNFGP